MSDFPEIQDLPDDIEPVDMEIVGRSGADGYALFAVVFAVVGIIIPVLPAAAALMLVHAVEQEETNPRTAALANAAATIAYFALAVQAVLCLVLLIGVFFKILQ